MTPQARKAFEEELGQDPSNANAAYELAEMHRKAGELEPARKLFEQALAHYPGSITPRSDLHAR